MEKSKKKLELEKFRLSKLEDTNSIQGGGGTGSTRPTVRRHASKGCFPPQE